MGKNPHRRYLKTVRIFTARDDIRIGYIDRCATFLLG